MLKQKQVSSFLLLPTRFLLGHMIQVSGLGFQFSIKFNLFFYGCTQMENTHQQLLLLSPQDLVLFFDVALKISFLGLAARALLTKDKRPTGCGFGCSSSSQDPGEFTLT